MLPSRHTALLSCAEVVPCLPKAWGELLSNSAPTMSSSVATAPSKAALALSLDVCRWIIQKVRPGIPNYQVDSAAQCLYKVGLEFLLVRELKKLYEQLRLQSPQIHVYIVRKGLPRTPTGNKATIVQFLTDFIKEPVVREVIERDIDPNHATNNEPASSTTSATSATAATLQRKPPPAAAATTKAATAASSSTASVSAAAAANTTTAAKTTATVHKKPAAVKHARPLSNSTSHRMSPPDRQPQTTAARPSNHNAATATTNNRKTVSFQSAGEPSSSEASQAARGRQHQQHQQRRQQTTATMVFGPRTGTTAASGPTRYHVTHLSPQALQAMPPQLREMLQNLAAATGNDDSDEDDDDDDSQGSDAAVAPNAAARHPSTAGDPSVTPKPGTREVALMYQLLNMGFTDRVEVLSTIRTCMAANIACTADDVMLECVKLREEMDEARKMDAARLESERVRKEEAQRRRTSIAQEARQSVLDSPLESWQSNHFPNSWILQDASTRNALETSVAATTTSREDALKEALLNLLEQEKKARKWYGKVLPSAWFARVCAPQLVDAATHTTTLVTTTIQSQLTVLETGMFSLDEQTKGGVPKMFLNAHDEYGDSNLPGESTTGDGSGTSAERVTPHRETDVAGNEVIILD